VSPIPNISDEYVLQERCNNATAYCMCSTNNDIILYSAVI